jgi:hypothetical protein
MPTIPKRTIRQTLFGNIPQLTLTNWVLAVGGTVASSANPQGCGVTSLATRLIEITTNGAEDPENFRVRSTWEVDLEITYSDAIDQRLDYSFISLSATYTYNDSNFIFEAGLARPTMQFVFTPPTDPYRPLQKVPTVDGHTVTFEGGDWAESTECPLAKLIFDWGDGTIEQRELFSRFGKSSVTGFDDGEYWRGALMESFSHTYEPDANGNGSGQPITVYAVDAWGRRSLLKKRAIDPKAVMRVTVADDNGDFVFDTRDSYGITGKIVSRSLVYVSPSLSYPISTDPEIDPNGGVFRVPITGVGRFIFQFTLADNGAAATDSTVTFKQGAVYMIQIERPNESICCLPSGTVIYAQEVAGVLYSPQSNERTLFTAKMKNYLRKKPVGSEATISFFWPWSFRWGNFEATPYPSIPRDPLPHVSAPRLKNQGGELYLAGRHHPSGETRLWRSFDEAREWKELGMIWTPDYYHSDLELLTSNGAVSVALKRVAAPETPNSETRYYVECWFRKTYDKSKWESEPRLVGTTAVPFTLNETLSMYPHIKNEALAGGSNRLLIYALFQFFESVDEGKTTPWRQVAS